MHTHAYICLHIALSTLSILCIQEHLVQLIDACLNKGDAKGICGEFHLTSFQDPLYRDSASLDLLTTSSDGLRLLFTNRKREHIQNRVSVASRSPEPIVLGVITRCLEWYVSPFEKRFI